MKNTAINTLEYTGIVTLSQYIGSKKIEIARIANAGGNPLFTFLADCLAGDFDVAKLNRPKKIMLLKRTAHESTDGETATSYDYESKSYFIDIRNKPEKVYTEEKKGLVRYSFMISRDILEGAEFNGIGLYTESAKDSDLANFAAFCEVTDSIGKPNSLSSSSVLVIDWELSISNKNKEDT
jgi:hypothetical protein